MSRVFAEWRGAQQPVRGGLVWFLKDLWPGAGWGWWSAGAAPKRASTTCGGRGSPELFCYR